MVHSDENTSGGCARRITACDWANQRTARIEAMRKSW